ncbi:unnamed protein product [Thlaspi arvense]|uniref:Uncharacterized protein n=1 Tax=Thlaspi arvense TaxID=13288 RepID=A0AAU9S299_THLAR|nr:unnamed protein product [Thlaspi arvense]
MRPDHRPKYCFDRNVRSYVPTSAGMDGQNQKGLTDGVGDERGSPAILAGTERAEASKRRHPVGEATFPKGTNVWIDVVAMHHDPSLWGDDVNEFRPRGSLTTFTEGASTRWVSCRSGSEEGCALAEIYPRWSTRSFSFSISPEYRHRPSYLLSLRPSHGLPLVLEPLRL